MPKVSDAHVEARRQQIMEAAQACFARQGFHQTSIQDICQEAALSPGAVYKYFSSKDHIIAAACLGCQQESIDFIESAKSQGSRPLQVLDFIVEHAFSMLDHEHSQEHAMMTIQLWSEAMRSTEVKDALLSATFDTWVEALTELFEQAQAQGEVDPNLDARSLARIMFDSLVTRPVWDEPWRAKVVWSGGGHGMPAAGLTALSAALRTSVIPLRYPFRGSGHPVEVVERRPHAAATAGTVPTAR